MGNFNISNVNTKLCEYKNGWETATGKDAIVYTAKAYNKASSH